jgi:hypothetical protein
MVTADTSVKQNRLQPMMVASSGPLRTVFA